MIFGSHFALSIDQKSLIIMFGSKKVILVFTTDSLRQCRTTPLGCQFNIKYKLITDLRQDNALMIAIETETEVRRVFEDAVDGLPLIFTTINGATEDNEIVREVRDYFPTIWPNRFQ